MSQYMPQYKLAAFDMDGTLLRPDSSLSDYTAGVLRAAGQQGVRIVPCTGRPYAGTLNHLRKIGLDTCGVFCNGAQLRRTLSGEILSELPLRRGDALMAIELGLEAGGHPRAYIGDKVYVTHIIEEDELYAKRTGSVLEAVGDLRSYCGSLSGPALKVLKVLNKMPGAESMQRLSEKSKQVFGDRLNITQSSSTYMEYMHGDATKGSGLKTLAGLWGISKEEIVVAGDHLNDLAMFREAGFAIAPKNAQPAVLEAASCVCLGNDEDGVAKKIEEILGLKV